MAAPYALLDVRLTKTLTDEISLFVNGENLLNAGDPTYLAIQPMTILAGVTSRF
ncbi:hypothetical protein D3C72_2586800 [compost metagenome]